MTEEVVARWRWEADIPNLAKVLNEMGASPDTIIRRKKVYESVVTKTTRRPGVAVEVDCHVGSRIGRPPDFAPSTQSSNGSEQLLPLRAVENLTSLKKSTLYALIAQQMFPSSVPITRRRVAWRATEIQAWIAARNRIVQREQKTQYQRFN